jgi:hypothetical protein
MKSRRPDPSPRPGIRGCEICGRSQTQKAHIVAGRRADAQNVLALCPSCHVVFDTVLKPKLDGSRFAAGALRCEVDG